MRFVVDVMRFVVDIMRFVVDVVTFIADVVTFVVDARAQSVRIMCISQHYRITYFLKTNLKMREVDIVTNITIINITYSYNYYNNKHYI